MSSRACTRSAPRGWRSRCSRPRSTRRPRGWRASGGRGREMYVIIVGAGKVGWNLGRELLEKEHEVTLIENDHHRYLAVEQELEHNVQYGDASELWVLQRPGSGSVTWSCPREAC